MTLTTVSSTSVKASPPNRRILYPPNRRGAAGGRVDLVGSGSSGNTSTALDSSVPKRLEPPTPRILHSSAHATLDPLILNLISLICRWHVLSWYSAISRDPDRTFVRHVTSILVHVIQALEVRLADVDLVELVALDLPNLLEQHIEDFEEAEDKAHSGHAHNLDRDEVFHKLQSHIAVQLLPTPTGVPQPKVDNVYLRALVDNLLRLLLPPEDYRAETERTVVCEIIVNIILGNVFDKVAQPWFLYQIIAKVIEGRQAASKSKQPGVVDPTPDLSKVEASLGTVGTLKAVARAGLATLASLPAVFNAVTVSLSTLYHTAIASPVPTRFRDRPPLTTPALSLVLALLPPSTFLSQSIHYIQLPLALASSFVTSLVFYVFNEKVFTASLTKTILEAASSALFPDGRPPPKVQDPSPDEQAELMKRCERKVAEVLPPQLVNALIPPEVPDRPLALSRHLLAPLSSHTANVHLFVLVLDLVLGRIFPELVGQEG
ncbi:hypothetical protein P7C70_g3174, partial [Phenoliferia sp. Uapishka_3]